MTIKGWKKSQVSSGFYKKRTGEIPIFIKFERTENPFKGYHVLYKQGINGNLRILKSFKTKSRALTFARQYMRTH